MKGEISERTLLRWTSYSTTVGRPEKMSIDDVIDRHRSGYSSLEKYKYSS